MSLTVHWCHPGLRVAVGGVKFLENLPGFGCIQLRLPTPIPISIQQQYVSISPISVSPLKKQTNFRNSRILLIQFWLFVGSLGLFSSRVLWWKGFFQVTARNVVTNCKIFAPHWDEAVKGLAVEILEQSCLQKASQEKNKHHRSWINWMKFLKTHRFCWLFVDTWYTW